MGSLIDACESATDQLTGRKIPTVWLLPNSLGLRLKIFNSISMLRSLMRETIQCRALGKTMATTAERPEIRTESLK